MRAQGFLLFLSAHIYIFIPLVVELFYSILIPILDVYSTSAVLGAKYFQPLAVLKFYHPTFDLFLQVIQEEIPFNESSIFTFALWNLWFVSVGFHCQITEVQPTTLFCPCHLWCQMRWAINLESACIILACAFANGLELLRPSFILQWAGIPPSMFHFAMGWNSSAHVLSWISPSIFLSQWSGCSRSEVDQRKRWGDLIILTDSSPVFSCSGQLKRILSSKPLINHCSRRRLSSRKHVIMGSCHAMHVMVGSWVCNESCNWACRCHVIEHVMGWWHVMNHVIEHVIEHVMEHVIGLCCM